MSMEGWTMKIIAVPGAEERVTKLEKELREAIEPMCIGCRKHPDELACYALEADELGISATDYVKQEEGTYNVSNGHFACDRCYISMGMPTSPLGWTAP